MAEDDVAEDDLLAIGGVVDRNINDINAASGSGVCDPRQAAPVRCPDQ